MIIEVLRSLSRLDNICLRGLYNHNKMSSKKSHDTKSKKCGYDYEEKVEGVSQHRVKEGHDTKHKRVENCDSVNEEREEESDPKYEEVKESKKVVGDIGLNYEKGAGGPEPKCEDVERREPAHEKGVEESDPKCNEIVEDLGPSYGKEDEESETKCEVDVEKCEPKHKEEGKESNPKSEGVKESVSKLEERAEERVLKCKEGEDKSDDQKLPSDEEGRIRFLSYLVGSIVRASDEIYQICLTYSHSALSREVSTMLQDIAFDFLSLDEWLKSKPIIKNPPLPERKSAPLLIRPDLLLDQKDENVPDGNGESSPCENISVSPRVSQSSGIINVAAPDFIPASHQAQDKTMTDQNIQDQWSFPSSTTNFECGNVADPPLAAENNINHDCSSFLASPYFENPEEYELDSSHRDQDYEQTFNSTYFNSPNFPPVHSNLYSFTPSSYQQPFSPQYFTSFQPYSMYPQDFSSSIVGMNPAIGRTPYGFYGNSYRSRQQRALRTSLATDRQHYNKLSKNNEARSEDSRVVKGLRRENDPVLVSKESDAPALDDKTNEASAVHVGSDSNISSLEKDSSEKNKKDLNDLTISSDSVDNQNLNKQSIIGLTEKDSIVQFPLLSSEYQKGSKPKMGYSGVLQKALETKGPSDSKYKASSTGSINCGQKSTSNSKVSKTPIQAAEKQPLSQKTSNYSTTLRSKTKASNSATEKQPCTKKHPRETLNEQVSVNATLQNEKEDNSDSEGWELVKTRSKWRDNTDSRSSRLQMNKNNKHYFKSSHPHRDQNSQFFGSSLCRDNERSILSEGGSPLVNTVVNERIISGICDEDHFNSLTVVTNVDTKFENTDDFKSENISNEGWYSSENSYEVSLDQSEETSPADSKCMEKIDPNEMYSAYMKYLSNVEEGNSDSVLKPAEKILHPMSEGVTSCNPASLEEMTDFVNEDPVRALDFKNKLADKIRHQEDVKKRNEAKQQLALKKRLQFLHDKTAKFRGLVEKVKEVKAAQDQLALQRKNRLDLKLKKAEEKRKMHLNIIKRKAHDEEEKLKEIAFINELEAQNRRHDSLALRQEHEERLQYLVEERQRKLEEKAAKEAAVEERRKALEAERKEKLELMRERRRRKEEFIDRKQQEKEQERLVIAREKAREREERLQAIHIAQQANAEELQKRIQQKQEESQKRHIECIELIRQKAIEIGLHRNNIDNSSNHINFYKNGDCLKGHKAHDKYKLHLKKRLKKIKSRMVMRGSNFIEKAHSSTKELAPKETILQKLMKKLMTCELNKTFIWQDEYIESVDHYLDEILLYLQEDPNLCDELKDMKAFVFFESVINTFNCSSHDKVSGQSLRCIIKIITIYDLSCLESAEICLYILLSNILATLLDSLRFSLQALELPSRSWALIVELLLRFHSLVIDGLNRLPDNMLMTIPDFSTRMKDLISYILCSGLVNRLTDLFRQTIIDEKLSFEPLLVPSILFFKRLLCSWFISDELINALKSTDLFGTVPFLYEGLIKQISDNDSLPDYCMPTVKLFLKLAEVDLTVFQEILGAENIALQWRGIASGLMTFCVPKKDSNELLNIIIKLVGYFAIHNKKNQTLLQSGKQPTVLQQLVKLPFQYFCDPQYMELLFPTLISCSYNNTTNRAIVESEVGYSGLERFMESDKGKSNKIIKLLLEYESMSPQ